MLATEGISKPLVSALERLHGSVQGFLSVALADANGLPIAFLGPATAKEASTAMASLLLAAAQRATQVLGLSRAQDLVVHADGAAVVVRQVGQRLTLLAILNRAADVERARLLVVACSDDVRILLEST